MAETKPINPWAWQDNFGFSQAIDVRGGQRTVFCAGQTSVDGDGNPLYAGDMAKQVVQAIDNLETVLKHAGLNLSNVVRLNYYTTDVAQFIATAGTWGSRLAKAQCKPASTLLGVQSLFHPDIMVELEATAVV